MGKSGGLALIAKEQGCAEQLARFFPQARLEFDDRLQIEADGAGRPAEASVVGVQYHEGRKAVAVRFLQGPCDWVVTQP